MKTNKTNSPTTARRIAFDKAKPFKVQRQDGLTVVRWSTYLSFPTLAEARANQSRVKGETRILDKSGSRPVVVPPIIDYFLIVEDFAAAMVGPFPSTAKAQAHFDWLKSKGHGAAKIGIFTRDEIPENYRETDCFTVEEDVAQCSTP